MPLNQADRENVLRYCDRDVPQIAQIAALFDYVKDTDLISALIREYQAARYIYKLQEALSVADEKLAAHAKFQIVQFASIYEAVIVHVLWTYYPDTAEVRNIEFYKPSLFTEDALSVCSGAGRGWFRALSRIWDGVEGRQRGRSGG